MNASQLKVGDRVRVVLEGEVTFVGEGSWTIANRNGFVRDNSPHIVSVERLPDPEPEWQPGDIITVGDFVTLVRIQDRWINPEFGTDYTATVRDDWADNPTEVRLLFRNGKPVSA